MKTWAKALLRASLLTCMVAGLTVAEAAAGTITYNFSGTVTTIGSATTADTGVIVGDTISGSFTYDPTQTGSNGTYTFTGVTKIHTFAFNIFNAANQKVFNDSYSDDFNSLYQLKVAYAAPSATGTTLNIIGATSVKDLPPYGPTYPAFDLTMYNPQDLGGYTSTSNEAIPTATTIKDFVATTGLVSWDPGNDSFSGPVTFQAVPEPSGLILLGAGMAGCAIAAVRSRRKLARVS